MTTVRALRGLLGGSMRLVALSVGLSLLQAVLIIPIGLLLRHVFDETIPQGDTGELVRIGVALVALGLAGAGLALWTRHLVLRAVKGSVATLRVRLLERLHLLPASWGDRQDAALLHTMVVQDSERLDIMMAALAAQIVPAAILTVAFAGAMVVLEPLLSLMIVPAAVVAVLIARRIGDVLRRRTQSWLAAFDRFSERVGFAVRARRLVRAYGTEHSELAAARSEIHRLSETGRAMAFTGAAYVQANSVVAMITAVAVLVVGGAAVIDHRTTLGSLASFFALCALLRGHLGIAASAIPAVVEGTESLRRLQPILEADEPQPYTGTTTAHRALPLELRGAGFGYGGRPPVLRDVTLEIRAGECVAITGPNGAGKTTIANLVLGLFRPDTGIVHAAGVPYDRLAMAALRRRMAYVGQDPVLFAGTIAANIAYGEPDADHRRVVEAARKANADDFISALPDGYETKIGDEGSLLSGGERQRIALARALLREPELLILDEPTTSLDIVSARAVLDCLDSVRSDRAVLVISHDPAVIDAADRVYRLLDGIAVEALERSTA